MELKDLEMQYKALWEEIEKLKGVALSIDFSKYVRKSIISNTIAINWNKMLKVYTDLTIAYDNIWTESFSEIPKCTLTTLSELKEGDVFIRKEDVKNMGISDFNIFVWDVENWDYMVQYLCNFKWKEYISGWIRKDCEVYKFLRD